MSVLNRSTSMMNGTSDVLLRDSIGSSGGAGGGGGSNGGAVRDTIAGVLGSRVLKDSSSPLQIFVRAKKKINDIYQEIEEYVAETTHYVQGMWVIKSRFWWLIG